MKYRYKNNSGYMALVKMIYNGLAQEKLSRKRYVHLKTGKPYVKMLPSGFSDGQTWGGLCKAWAAYIISCKNFEPEEKEYYAGVIQKLQHELGIKMTSFPEMNMTVLGFFTNNAEFMSDEMTGDEVIEQMIKDREGIEWKPNLS